MNDKLPTKISEEYGASDGFDLVSTPAHPEGYRAQYMGFKKGQYLKRAEQTPVPLGTEYVAVSASESWVRLEKDTSPVRIPREPGKPFPRRDELGDTNQQLWPVFADKPSDPWTHTLDYCSSSVKPADPSFSQSVRRRESRRSRISAG